MKFFTILRQPSALFAVALFAFTGCESTDGGGGSVSGGMYYGVGFHDPWYYGGYHDDDIDIIVPPNRPDRPGSGARPEHPIAQPTSASTRPTPTTSIPSTPRMAPRGGGGGGGGGRR